MKHLLLTIAVVLGFPALADQSSFSYPLVGPNESKSLRIESAVGCRNLQQTIGWLDSTHAIGMSVNGTLLPRNCEFIQAQGTLCS